MNKKNEETAPKKLQPACPTNIMENYWNDFVKQCKKPTDWKEFFSKYSNTQRLKTYVPRYVQWTEQPWVSNMIQLLCTSYKEDVPKSIYFHAWGCFSTFMIYACFSKLTPEYIDYDKDTITEYLSASISNMTKKKIALYISRHWEYLKNMWKNCSLLLLEKEEVTKMFNFPDPLSFFKGQDNVTNKGAEVHDTCNDEIDTCRNETRNISSTMNENISLKKRKPDSDKDASNEDEENTEEMHNQRLECDIHEKVQEKDQLTKEIHNLNEDYQNLILKKDVLMQEIRLLENNVKEARASYDVLLNGIENLESQKNLLINKIENAEQLLEDLNKKYNYLTNNNTSEARLHKNRRVESKGSIETSIDDLKNKIKDSIISINLSEAERQCINILSVNFEDNFAKQMYLKIINLKNIKLVLQKANKETASTDVNKIISEIENIDENYSETFFKNAIVDINREYVRFLIAAGKEIDAIALCQQLFNRDYYKYDSWFHFIFAQLNAQQEKYGKAKESFEVALLGCPESHAQMILDEALLNLQKLYKMNKFMFFDIKNAAAIDNNKFKAKYHALAKKYHPDKYNSEEVKEQFKLLVSETMKFITSVYREYEEGIVEID